MTPAVLVTGGTRGLGRELVEAFSAGGWSVASCGRKPPVGDLPARFFTCDVRDPEQVAAMVDSAAEHLGGLDAVVNNAGGTPYADAASMSPRLAEKVVALNLMAPFYVAQRARPILAARPEGGAVINIGSTAAQRPATNSAPYVAAKAGLVGLTRALAVEWAPDVRVNLVTPGLLRTEMVDEVYGSRATAAAATVPMRRMATGADVAAACLALLGPGMRYVTGADLVVDGGGEFPAWSMAVQP